MEEIHKLWAFVQWSIFNSKYVLSLVTQGSNLKTMTKDRMVWYGIVEFNVPLDTV